MQSYQVTESIKIDRELIKSVADSLAEEMARRMYYKLLILKFLPEIKAVEKGKLKILRGKEIDEFLAQLIRSNCLSVL
jgi:hypothetical protein